MDGSVRKRGRPPKPSQASAANVETAKAPRGKPNKQPKVEESKPVEDKKESKAKKRPQPPGQASGPRSKKGAKAKGK